MRKAISLCLVLTALAVAGCAAKRSPQAQYPPPKPYVAEDVSAVIQTEPVPPAQQMAGQEGIIELMVTDEGFNPTVITTTVGERVKIHLINRGRKAHTLTIPRIPVFSQNLEPGGENYIEFTAGEKGVWTYFSDAPGEPEPGLVGELRVE